MKESETEQKVRKIRGEDSGDSREVGRKKAG